MNPSQENRLERMLRLTADDRSQYKKCLATLLDSRIYIVLSPFVRQDLSNLIDTKGKFRVNMWRTNEGIKIVPFFSSLPLLKATDRGAKAISVPGYEFFSRNQGRGLSLNPGHPYGLNFNSDDSRRLLWFNYKNYLAQLSAEEAEVNQGDCPSNSPRTAKIIDFSKARIARGY